MKFSFFALALLFSLSLQAAPPGWEPNFGEPISELTGEDDRQASVELSFDFPFAGTNYSTIFVGTNGGLQLGDLGKDNDIDYDHWDYMQEFLSDGSPSIAGFNTDLDLTSNGSIHFNDFGDRAVFTWNEVGTNKNEDALISFQILLTAKGRIVLSYAGVLDGPEESLIGDLDEGIVIGISAGLEPEGTEPGPSDLARGVTSNSTEIYERWCFDEADSCGFNGGSDNLPGPVNSAFDYDQKSFVFTPQGTGFSVRLLVEESCFAVKAANENVVTFCL